MTKDLWPNVFQIQHQGCRKHDGTSWKLDHGPYVLDEDLMEVTCGTCKERLNPMRVLLAYAYKENSIHRRFMEMQQAIEKTKFKAERQNRVRCEHCQKLTRIRK